MYETSDIRKGLRIELDGEPYMIIDFQFVKPGKGNAFTRTKIRNLINGSVLDRTFKTGEKITRADTEEREMQFLYNDGSWHFMDSQSYEQVSLEAQLVGDSGDYLSENMEIQISFYQGRPIGLTLPNFVNLGVVETTPGERGNTVTGATKPAVLESGATVYVPLFINEGDIVRVDTESSSYTTRVTAA